MTQTAATITARRTSARVSGGYAVKYDASVCLIKGSANYVGKLAAIPVAWNAELTPPAYDVPSGTPADIEASLQQLDEVTDVFYLAKTGAEARALSQALTAIIAE